MSKQTGNKFSPKVRSRAVRLVLDQRRGGPTSCGLFRKPLNLPRTKCDGAHFSPTRQAPRQSPFA